ncbi:MAG: hypothetical protein IT370_38005 [Deltaproteobacteria bacterium]|nr:hypothetical protein [Deltaproteobacteria bacterium]
MPRARLLLLPLVSALWAAPAAANGRAPAMMSVQRGADGVVLGGATFGAALQQDGAFRWICEGAIGYGGFFDPQFERVGATLLASTFDGLARSEDGGCSWGYAQGDLLDHFVGGFAVSPGDPAIVIAGSGTLGRDNALMRSTDGGRSFQALAATSSARELWTSVRFAPGDGQRVYATSFTVNPGSNTLWVSRDAGASFTPLAFAPGGGQEVRLLAVHPGNADLLYVRTIAFNNDDSVQRSTNAGMTWQQVFTSPEIVSDLVVASDGRAALATRPSGLARAPDGVAFTRITGAPAVTCIDLRGAQLWGCGNNAPQSFALGSSDDFGATWTPRFRHSQLASVLTCPVGAVASWLPDPTSSDPLKASRSTAALCDPLWPATVQQLGVLPQDGGPVVQLDAGPADAGAGLDAGRDDGADGGCGCRTGGAHGGPDSAPLAAASVLLAALVVALRQRR